MSESVDAPYARLRRDLLGGRYAEGDWLRESTLAEQLGTSRTPVRDALRQLHGDGLVELIPNRGARVTGYVHAAPDDIADLRTLLEGYAARRAAESGAADLARLEELCAAMETAYARPGDSSAELTDLNLAFHAEIHRGAGNALLPGVLEGIIAIGLVRRAFHSYDDERTRLSFIQHRELLRALSARDGDWAEAVMVAHIRGAHDAVHHSTPQPDPSPHPETRRPTHV
ncbi:GntR family transcriptional regulator [Nocardioides insulae]|uniref:GntR family transcriptional regulator n=1 Tax=Nocardioides insulae TaxID=394734 RepID=UPI0003F6719A|nr:GntR family transcriptional regulator [Nocardioides insulae]